MALSNRCMSSFKLIERQRGGHCFYMGRVRLGSFAQDYFEAKVSSSNGTLYNVVIRWDPAKVDELTVGCTCPYFRDGHLCMHLWAALLAADTRNVGPQAREIAEFRVRRATREDGWLDDNPNAASGMAPPPGAIIAPSGPPWRLTMQQIRQQSQHRLHERVNAQAEPERVWYVLDYDESMASDSPVVRFHVCGLNADSSRGPVRRKAVDRSEIPRLQDAADRELLSLLAGDVSESAGMYGSSFLRHPQLETLSRCQVARGTYATIFPKLVATGRFLGLPAGDQNLDDGRALAWDDGPPWKFQLQFRDDPAGEGWTVEGRLVRGDERLPLQAAVFCLRHGLVGFPGRLALLDAEREFDWIAALRANGPLFIPHHEANEFAERFWKFPSPPTVADLPPVMRWEQRQVPPQGKLKVLSPKYAFANRQLTAEVFFVYEGCVCRYSEPDLLLSDVRGRAVYRRDMEREQSLFNELLAIGLSRPRPNYYPEERGNVTLQPKELPAIVDRLISRGWLVEADGRLFRQPGAVHVSVSSGVDWFDLDGHFDFDGQQVKLPALLAALKRGDKHVLLDDGSQGMLPQDWLARFGPLLEMAAVEGDQLRFKPNQAMILDALLAAQPSADVDKRFQNYRRRIQKFTGVKPRRPPASFNGELRDYQATGLGWLHFLRDFQLGGCLADDMGLGKTIQVLALLEDRRVARQKAKQGPQPSLVVVPKSLVFNWLEEARRFAPALRTLTYIGMERETVREELGEYDLVVTTYGTLRRDINRLKDVKFDYAILDEAQAIKNHNAQAAKASRLIQAEHRLAMTGTPVENHLGELWSIFEFLNPGMLGRSSAFRAFVRGPKAGAQAASVPRISPEPGTSQVTESPANDVAEPRDLLAHALRPYLLRRTKEQVLQELPEKTEQTLFCEMDKKQRKLYDELREYYRKSLADKVGDGSVQQQAIHVLEALLRLRQAACHPGLLNGKNLHESSAKLETLVEQVQEITAEGHKALIFSQFTSFLDIVRLQLDKLDLTYEYLDGQTHNRQRRVDRFQTDPNCSLFLISLKAGGFGLNLTAADYVFILDPWWNPAVESQAVDRAHRLGQTRPVIAYRLICRDTVEEKILQLQESKRDLAESIINQDNSLIRNLSAEDLQLLLS